MMPGAKCHTPTSWSGRGKRQRLEQDAVDDAEDERVGANRHAQRDERGEGEDGATDEASKSVSHGRVDVGAPEEVRGREGFRLQALGFRQTADSEADTRAEAETGACLSGCEATRVAPSA